MTEFWEVVRWFNAFAAAFVVVILVAGTVKRWDVMPARLQRIVPWVICTYAVIAYGSGEVASAGDAVSPGIRVAMLTLTLSGLIVALLYGFHDEDY